MLTLVTLMFVTVAALAGAVEYWLWLQRKFSEDSSHQDHDGGGERRISFVVEALACVGAILVLVGSCVAISQHWLKVTNPGRVAILASVAICFLIAGFLVRWLTASVTQPLTELMWCASAACVTGAAAIAAAGVYRQTATVTVLISGVVLAAYSAALWLLCRRELLMGAVFIGLIGTLCGAILVIATQAAPLLAAALGLWLLGVGWVTLGWVYPDPLGTSVSVGAAIALIAPAIAVHDRGWLYIIGIATAAAAMAASVPLRNVVLVAFGSCALFAYITAVVLRYADRSLGVPESLVIIGLSLIGLAITTVRLGRAARPPLTTSADLASLRSAELSHAREHGSTAHLNGGHATNGHATNGHATNGHAPNGHAEHLPTGRAPADDDEVKRSSVERSSVERPSVERRSREEARAA
jgi:hypothetical protein